MANVLYITYDGLTDPLGRSQILPYLQGCAANGHRITILSCEKLDRLRKGERMVAALCAESGIDWRFVRYHKRPPVLSTVYDARMLTRAAAALHRERGFDLVHCRSYIAAIAGFRLKSRDGVPLLFDMRGFWPEEKTEGGAWDLRNPLYRQIYNYFKQLESDLLRESDHIVSLTEAGKRHLLSRPECAGRPDRISVIPCCVDFDHFPLAEEFRDETRSQLGIESSARVLAYLGSIGTWYMLDEMLDFFRVFAANKPDARFLFVTMDDPEAIRIRAARHGVDPQRILIRPASREEVPRLLAAADAGISFIKPVFSKTASSPTKLGEMLAMGIPVIANAGVGDVESILKETGCGVVAKGWNERGYADAVKELGLLKLQPKEIRKRAQSRFDLATAVDRYCAIYNALG